METVVGSPTVDWTERFVIGDEKERAQEVREAAAWLDVRYPGWEQKIDLSLFNMRCGTACIGFYLLGTNDGWMTLRSQYRDDHKDIPVDLFAWGTALWREEIRNRVCVSIQELEEELVGA